jgi:hypothetical protein
VTPWSLVHMQRFGARLWRYILPSRSGYHRQASAFTCNNARNLYIRQGVASVQLLLRHTRYKSTVAGGSRSSLRLAVLTWYKKKKLSSNVIQTQNGAKMSGFHPHSGIRHNQDIRVVCPTCRPHFTPQEVPWYSFMSETEWTPGLVNADRLGKLKVFKEPIGNRDRDLLSCEAVPQPTAPRTPMRVQK